MNPRRRRHQRIRRKRQKNRARIDELIKAMDRRAARVRIGRVISVDPITGIAEVEVDVTLPGSIPTIRTEVGLTLADGEPL